MRIGQREYEHPQTANDDRDAIMDAYCDAADDAFHATNGDTMTTIRERDTYCHAEASEFRPGDRVELAPHHDAWMRGDRFATVHRVSASLVWVTSDISGRLRWFHPQSLRFA